jgi:hypothetical protein
MSGSAHNKDLERTRELASRLVDGTATAGEATELSTLLRTKPELRDAYLAYVDTHALLSWEFRSEAEQATQAAAHVPQPIVAAKVRFATIVPWSLAALAGIVAIAALLRPVERNQVANSSVVGGGAEQTAVGDASTSDLIAALVVDEAGAEFAPERAPQGVRVGPGDYELLKGVVHLRFAEGADLVLAGPAKLFVTDSLHVRLAYGKVRVIAPPTAQGFTIATPAADYVDLGTEFGLRVEPNGASDLYVFDGQVNVAEANSGRILSEVFEGSSSRCVRGVTDTAPELKETDFPNPGAIGFVRWQEYERRMNADRDLLGFYPFRRTGDEAALANTQRDRIMTDGRIAGPRWTLGRWPGKEALLFERDTDFVGLEVPGEHHELSIAAWIKVDRLDFELNAILNSDGSEPGDVHFQMTRQGLVRGGLLGPKPYDNFVGNPVQVGRWAHVAIVISALNHTQKIYVDGKLSRDRPFVGEAVIRPGVCRLGNWLPQAMQIEPNRALRGRIDEFAIWKRALTEGELARLIEASRPELLWNETSPAVATHR